MNAISILLICIGVVIIILGSIFKRKSKPISHPKESTNIVKTTAEQKLIMLTSLYRYKESQYQIQKMNNSYYVLMNKSTLKYVDLKTMCYEWPLNDRFYKDCKGNVLDVINAFEELVPIIEVIESSQVF